MNKLITIISMILWSGLSGMLASHMNCPLCGVILVTLPFVIIFCIFIAIEQFK